MKYLKLSCQIITFVFLTILTQIGGIIYVLISFLNKRWDIKHPVKKVTVFLVTYLLATFLIIPFIAPIFGREKIRNSNSIQPVSYMTVLLNRNYVRPDVNRLLERAGFDLKDTRVRIHYLDANFPFINKFPLLPHLSHNDGRKIDLSLIYQTPDGQISTEKKSRSGYGVFEEPKGNEVNQVYTCLSSGYFQYDYPKYLTLGKVNKSLEFSGKGTKLLVAAILKQPDVEKLFIEPHLKGRLELNSAKIRYHGCRAVRHDDHIHIQVK
jgi:hypothetical protein